MITCYIIFFGYHIIIFKNCLQLNSNSGNITFEDEVEALTKITKDLKGVVPILLGLAMK